MNAPNNINLSTPTLWPNEHSDVKKDYLQVSSDYTILTTTWITDMTSVYVTDKISEADPFLLETNHHQLTKKYLAT
jgi:hypothetical protein